MRGGIQLRLPRGLSSSHCSPPGGHLPTKKSGTAVVTAGADGMIPVDAAGEADRGVALEAR